MLKFLKAALALAAFAFITTPAHANSINPQVVCLAQNMYHEARGEGERGMIAVSNVVMNRVRSGKFPSTPCGVIYQRTRRTCQFSWVCQRNKSIRESTLYRRALALADSVYHNRVFDISHGALFYHANYVRPSWSHSFRRTASIGTHLFYNFG